MLPCLAVALWLGSEHAAARESDPSEGAPVPCALITQVTGLVDLMDSSRTHLLDVSQGAAVPCGGWVSVDNGAAELKHRDGFEIHVGAGSFVQLTESNADGRHAGDQAVLFRGQVYARSGGGSGELRISTANARARLHRGSVILVYNHEDEVTQLVSLEGKATLENRFEPARLVETRPGEATELNFKQLRVLPSTPRAVALAALRPKFADLRVPERDRTAAIVSTHQRQERVFATELAGSGAQKESASVGVKGEDVQARLRQARERAPASSNDYSSHADEASVRAAHQAWVSRMTGGAQGNSEAIVTPGSSELAKQARKAGRGIASAGGAGSRTPRGKARRMTAEDEEKMKLIEELSRLREE